MIQGLVLNRFSWNSHAWCGSTYGWTLLFLETTGPIEPPIWRKMCPQNQFFGFHSTGIEFFMEKTYKQYLVPHSPQKRFNSFLLSDAFFASKMVMSPKNYFSRLFWKICFFFVFFLRKLFSEKYLKPHFLQKKIILIFVTRCPLSLKTAMFSHKWFFAIFSKNAALNIQPSSSKTDLRNILGGSK